MALPNNKWLDVEEYPLFIKSPNGYWLSTAYADKQFLAAVPTNHGWWIRLCCLVDDVGLAVVTGDDWESAGWDMEDVTHFMLLEGPHTLQSLDKNEEE